MEETHVGLAELLPGADVVRGLRSEGYSLNTVKHQSATLQVEKIRVVCLLETLNKSGHKVRVRKLYASYIHHCQQLQPFCLLVPLNSYFSVAGLRIQNVGQQFKDFRLVSDLWGRVLHVGVRVFDLVQQGLVLILVVEEAVVVLVEDCFIE